MVNPIAALLSDRKVHWFAGLGALGCLAAALVGELWLGVTQPTPVKPSAAVSLLLDTSGSMYGEKLVEMKLAAAEFVRRQDLSVVHVSVVGFDSVANLASPLSQDEQEVLDAIGRLEVGGSTNMSEGLDEALATLPADEPNSFILLFTDGQPDSQDEALQSASKARTRDARIMAIATKDADSELLAQLTSDPQRVFPASDGQFGVAFESAGETIRHLIGSSDVRPENNFGMVRVGVWTALLAAGVGLALIIGQNLYLRRQPLTRWQALAGGLSCAAVGLVAGLAGQWLFQTAADEGALLVVLGRMAGWTLMGGLVGLGLAWFVPNLKLVRGLVGGAVGGVIGVACFLALAATFGEAVGRVAGAAAVGFCIGAMIALFEAALREAWLEVEYGPGETRNISLGREPVSVGSDGSRCAVFIRQAAPVALEYTLKDGQVTCRDVQNNRESTVPAGDVRTVDRVKVRVQAVGAAQPDKDRNGERSERTTTKAAKPDGQTYAADASGSENGTLQIIIQGRKTDLMLGVRLHARSIPGIESRTPDKEVAEVVANPHDPSVLGLKNLMDVPWESSTPDGRRNQVEPGRSLKLTAGTRIHFGKGVEGMIL